MSNYRVVFVNGEKRELVIEADAIVQNGGSLVQLMKSGKPVAAIPLERVLFIERIDD